MTNFETMLRQQATFSLKVFFAPIYGSYLAIREALREREANVEADELRAQYEDGAARTKESNVVFLTTDQTVVRTRSSSGMLSAKRGVRATADRFLTGAA